MDRGLPAPPHGKMCAAAWGLPSLDAVICLWQTSRQEAGAFTRARTHSARLVRLSNGFTEYMANQPLQHYAVAILHTKMINQHEDGSPRQTEPRALSTAGLYWAIRTRATRAARVNPAIPAYAGTNKAMTGNPPRCPETPLHTHIQVSQYDMDVAVTQRYSKQANPIN